MKALLEYQKQCEIKMISSFSQPFNIPEMHNTRIQKISNSSYLRQNRNPNSFAKNSNILSIVALQNATGLVDETQNTLK